MKRRNSNKIIAQKKGLLEELQSKKGPNDRGAIDMLDKEIADLLEFEDIKWK